MHQQQLHDNFLIHKDPNHNQVLCFVLVLQSETHTHTHRKRLREGKTEEKNKSTDIQSATADMLNYAPFFHII